MREISFAAVALLLACKSDALITTRSMSRAPPVSVQTIRSSNLAKPLSDSFALEVPVREAVPVALSEPILSADAPSTTSNDESNLASFISTKNTFAEDDSSTEAATPPEGTTFGLADIRKAIPAEAFEKSLPKSLFYLFFDYSMWGGALFAIRSLVQSSLWSTLPLWTKALASIAYWNVAGFFMWCIFVVGHDCGHTTFSNYKWLNNIIGHITHGSLLVPFFSWQLSHRRHHMFHNHIEKDYSYSWFTPDVIAKEIDPMTLQLHKNKVIKFFLPFFGWFMYLLGVRDGNHFIPIKSQRLWQQTPRIESIKCLISTAVVGLFAAGNWFAFGRSWKNVAFYYLAPLVMFGWWLVTVTYLQHHHEDSVVYDNEDWQFMKAGFETVDRLYGFPIDHLHHHISDGHVIHHLFYTLIPHYNLPLATKALRDFLQQHQGEHLYRYEKTLDFPKRVHSYLMRKGFAARRANPAWGQLSVPDL